MDAEAQRLNSAQLHTTRSAAVARCRVAQRCPALPGAPLWQLVDFAPALPAAHRAGLEAALMGAGLLDAWVTPDGALWPATDTAGWLDAQWLLRPARPAQPLSRWLQPAFAQHSTQNSAQGSDNITANTRAGHCAPHRPRRARGGAAAAAGGHSSSAAETNR